ncbi:MAG: heavy-metal-associated domain-containing protein [Porticoccaceae bacterium]
MKKLFLAIFILSATASGAEPHHMGHMDHMDHMDHTEHMHSHEGHVHDTMVDGQTLSVDAERFDNFVDATTGDQVVVVSVQGMVCDFCARGIEKTFGKDSQVTKIDVDLVSGKVLLAYVPDAQIDRQRIEKSILNNGLNTTAIQLVAP